MTVVSVLRLTAHPGREDDLIRAFDELDILERSRASGGFLGGRLLRAVGGGSLLVLAEWETSEDYQGWIDNPVRAELGGRLEPLLAADVQAGELFEEC